MSKVKGAAGTRSSKLMFLRPGLQDGCIGVETDDQVLSRRLLRG